MNPQVSETVRLDLRQSVDLVSTRRDLIVEKVRERLVQLEEPPEAFGQAEATAMVLVDMLIDGARRIASAGEPGDLDAEAREHRRWGVRPIHYSRFGIAIGPALREVGGPVLSPQIRSAWIEAFWLLIREASKADLAEPVAAATRRHSQR